MRKIINLYTKKNSEGMVKSNVCMGKSRTK